MKRGTILLIVLIFAFCISLVSAPSFGIAPQSITIEDAEQGESYDKRIIVGNRGTESGNYEFVGTGGIWPWVSFYASDGETPIDTFVVPSKSSERLIARFSVPEGTSNGVYSGTVSVQTIPQAVAGEEPGAVAQAVLKLPIEVTIAVGGDLLAEKETLIAEGDLITISTVDEPQIGQVIEILATFENTGAIDTNAKFVGELYIDGNRVDDVTSDELLTPAGETSDLAAYVSIETPGEYVIKGHVLYEGKKTDIKELSFSVLETESATDSGTETESETPAVTQTPTPTTEADLATETPTVTDIAPAVTETPTPTPEADLAMETPAGTEAETDTKVPGFGIIGTLIATVVVFVIAKKSGKKGEK